MSIESEYRRRVNAMTGPQKIRRCEELFEWALRVQLLEIIAEHGPMPASRLRRELALRMYGADPSMRP